MGEIRITLEEETNLEFEYIDIGTSEEVISFDVSGQIVGLDETTLNRLVGERFVPTQIILEPQNETCRDQE